MAGQRVGRVIGNEWVGERNRSEGSGWCTIRKLAVIDKDFILQIMLGKKKKLIEVSIPL